MRMIDADALKESIKKQADICRSLSDELAEYADVMEKGFLQEVDNAPTINQWIPVSKDNMPEDNETVLISDCDDVVTTATFRTNGEYFTDFAYENSWDLQEVKAWMSRPEPYRGDEE